MTTWPKHVERWVDCIKCPLCHQRFRTCLARGTVPCDVLFVGEAPGASEDAIGQPFVGPAGHLLDQIIDRALPTSVTTSMTNLVACFPKEAKDRGDNEPERAEILACRPRLIEFANIARPRLTVCVGGLAHAYVKDICTGSQVHITHPAHILARLPLAQKAMAANKCSVQIRTAWYQVLESKPVKFTNWGDKDADVEASRYHADPSLDDQIPF